MRWSQTFIQTLREAPQEAEIRSHRLMIRSGMIQKLSSGLYTFLPLGLRSLRKVEAIIRDTMNESGAIELLLPILQPKEIWTQSGRWDTMRDLMLVAQDRQERSFVLGPTHEEVITDLVSKRLKSYRDLPKNFYQIQTKFRDEIRPRFGLMRAREFLMKDAYSFDINDEASEKTYWNMAKAYQKIFTRCGLNFRRVEADTGVMGGSLSHEFMVLADSGEDEIFSCEKCGYAANREIALKHFPDASTLKTGAPCPQCKASLESSRGIEVGHVFKLGTKYSAQLGATVLNDQGIQVPCVMGCYGIGVSRTWAAFVEQNSTEEGIVWSRALAPFEVLILPLMPDISEIMQMAEKIYLDLKNKGIDVLLDDRGERPGVKFKDADLIGFPIQVTVGQKFLKEGTLEVFLRKDKKTEHIRPEDLIDLVIKYN